VAVRRSDRFNRNWTRENGFFTLRPGDPTDVENYEHYKRLTREIFKYGRREAAAAARHDYTAILPLRDYQLHKRNERRYVAADTGPRGVCRLWERLTFRSFVFIPRGTPHTRQNVGTKPLRFFATIMPATVAFEEFFKRYAQLPAEERGVEAFARVAAETKAFEVGPPLAESDPL